MVHKCSTIVHTTVLKIDLCCDISVIILLLFLGHKNYAFVEFYETKDATKWMNDNKV